MCFLHSISELVFLKSITSLLYISYTSLQFIIFLKIQIRYEKSYNVFVYSVGTVLYHLLDNTILSNSKLLYSLYSLTSELTILVFNLGLYSSLTNLNFKTPHFEAKTRIKTLSQAKIYLMQASQMNKMIRLYLIYFKFQVYGENSRCNFETN